VISPLLSGATVTYAEPFFAITYAKNGILKKIAPTGPQLPSYPPVIAAFGVGLMLL
jgi:hypothetical protein